MTRHIRCRPCHENYGSETGRHFRLQILAISAPDVRCDSCGKDLTGGVGMATTTWRMLGVEQEPEEWESGFGQKLTLNQLQLVDRLANEKGGDQ